MRKMLMLTAAAALVLAACGGNGDEVEPPAAEDEMQEEAATLQTADSDLGEILVDADGMTLYMFVPDQEADGEPTCYDECEQTWPVFEAVDQPTVGAGVDEAMLGTATRTDGTEQFTYNDLPLYYFSGDATAGDTNGQGLNDVWWVLGPDGSPIQE